jgi:hypothetical protein
MFTICSFSFISICIFSVFQNGVLWQNKSRMQHHHPQGVNFTNIFNAAFAPIFFHQKSTIPKCKHKNLCAKLLYEKAACKMLVKLIKVTEDDNCTWAVRLEEDLVRFENFKLKPCCHIRFFLCVCLCFVYQKNKKTM